MDNVLQKIVDKLAPSVHKIEQGTSSDHDILPAVLWTILMTDRDQLEQAERMSKEIDQNQQDINKAVEVLTQFVGTAILETGTKTSEVLREIHESQSTANSSLQKDLHLVSNEWGAAIRKLAVAIETETRTITHSHKLLGLLVVTQLLLTSIILITMLMK